MAHVTIQQLEAGFRDLTDAEQQLAAALLNEAYIIIDVYNAQAEESKKNLVALRMVRRALNTGNDFPMGATQGSMSAGGYTQSWTIGSNGSAGELYIGKLEKKILGANGCIGSRSPLEEFV